MASAYKLREVSPKEVRFSKQNPRGESPNDIKADKSFEQLKDSVSQFGVLVPIVVHDKKGRDGKKYTLIDGERRLRAALATGRNKIPAHIATAEDRMSELVQAFHIHMLRKQWKPVATARALRRIKTELRKRGRTKSDRDILDELQAQSGCTDSQLKTLERAIKYPEDVLKAVDDGKIAWSHLIQNEESFVEQLEQHYSRLLRKLGLGKVRDVLVQKARKRILTSTRALMENVAPIIARAKSKQQKEFVEKLLEDFIREETATAEAFKKRYEKKYPPPRDLVELADKIVDTGEMLEGMLQQLDVTQLVSFAKKAKAVKKNLEGLKTIITKKLRECGRFIR